MSRGRVVIFFGSVVLVAGLATAHEARIRRVRQSRADEFLQCAREVFGKPVFASAHLPWLGTVVLCGPDSDPEVLEEKLLAMQYGMKTFDAGEYIYLATKSFFERNLRPLTWKQVVIDTVAENWKTVRGSRLLTAAELAEIREVVVRQARTPPVQPPGRPKAGDPAKTAISIVIDVHSLRPNVESLVALYGLSNGVDRLVYGEFSEGKVCLKWDSPLFPGVDVRMAYADVNGDGVQEILLNSRAGRDGEWLTIFDVEGAELTRQERVGEDCADGSGGLYSDEGGVCSLGGNSIDLIPTADGKAFDLLVTLGEKETLYSLSGNRYVPRSTP